MYLRSSTSLQSSFVSDQVCPQTMLLSFRLAP
jgi:hypothetical protein